MKNGACSSEGVVWSRGMPLFGLAGGILIALGVPGIVLGTLNDPESWLVLTVVILSLIFGGTIALASAFFGIVVPRHVGESTNGQRGRTEVGVNLEIEGKGSKRNRTGPDVAEP